MLIPTAMQRINLQVLTEDAPKAALVLAGCGVFNPETTQDYTDLLPEIPGGRYRDLYRDAQSRLDKVLSHCALDHTPKAGTQIHHVTEQELADLDAWLQEVWKRCSECQEGMRRIEDRQKQIDMLLDTLDKFAALDIDLGLLQKKKHFLDIRIGTIPSDNVERLQDAVSIAGYVLTTFLVSNGVTHVVIAGPTGRETDINAAVQAAGWHALSIPPEFKDHPEKVRAKLIRQREAILEETVTQCEVIDLARAEFRERLIAARETLAMAAPFAEVGGALCGRGGLSLITGWVPKRDVARLRAALVQEFGERYVLSTRDPLPEERSQVPSVMRDHWLLKPFVTLVKTYGIPRYGEIDPTFLFGITFILMYGMMFGDVGHGAVIAVAGIALRRIIKQFTVFVVAVGLSSVVFGFLYGSIFGYEHVLHPVWMSPLTDPMRMLTLALYWGVGFIVLATLLTIRNRLVEGDLHTALYSNRGVAGLLFYLGLLYAGYRLATGAEPGWAGWGAILIPYAVILGHVWHENPASTGERVLIVVVEGFETVINYISNTLSFLRVAAFSLNHVALAIAVFTLANMLDVTGHWITVVLGNVFIIVFEGAIVAIQVLRLEYYEGFSRFFSGDGREFRPLHLPQWAGVGSNSKAS